MMPLVVAAAALLLLVVVAIVAMTLPPRGRVILLPPTPLARQRYWLVIVEPDGSERQQIIAPSQIAHVAAVPASSYDDLAVSIELAPGPSPPMLQIPAWAVPEARHLLAAAAVAMQDPYEYARRQGLP